MSGFERWTVCRFLGAARRIAATWRSCRSSGATLLRTTVLVEVSNYRADFPNVLGTFIRVLDAVSQRGKFGTQFCLQLLSLLEY
jgi:hypothetical protein